MSKGFTLLEMIIAVGIFIVVTTIAMSGLLNLSDVNKDSINFSNLSDNIRFALEMMAKEIRTGGIYNCGGTTLIPQNCPSGNVLTFKNALGNTIVYKSENSQIKRSSDGGANFLAMTASGIRIEELKFVVSGAPPGDSFQPKILIRIKANVSFKNKKTDINLQTLVSSRNLDS